MEKVGEIEVHTKIELRLPARARTCPRVKASENMSIVLGAGKNPGK